MRTSAALLKMKCSEGRGSRPAQPEALVQFGRRVPRAFGGPRSAAAAGDPDGELLPRHDVVGGHAVPGQDLRHRYLEELGNLRERVADAHNVGDPPGGRLAAVA